MRWFSLVQVLGLVGLAATSVASTYFTNPFDVTPTLSAVQAPGVWYTDRYAPQFFDSQFFAGDNRLRIGISAVDGAAVRPGSFGSQFYNTQGRKFDLGNGFYTSIKGQMYVGNDWDNNFRRSDMWATASGGGPLVFPIAGFANIVGTSGNVVCRVWDAEASGWVNVSAQVPGGVTTDRWYTIEIRIKPGAFEFLIDGRVVYVDGTVGGSTAFDNMIMQAYNFNDASLGAGNYPVGLNDSYDVYWDNITAGPSGSHGFPVDLNGTYRSTSSGPLDPNVGSQSGFAVAATGPIGFGNVFERNGVNALVDNAVNGSFTPFNDVFGSKPPRNLFVASAVGTAIEVDVDLSGTWKPFQWGQGVGNIPPFATGDTFGVGWMNGANSFGVRIATKPSGEYILHLGSSLLSTGATAILDTNGTPVTLPLGTTRVRINAEVAGTVLTATVMPLDGPNALNVGSLGSTDGTNMDTNAPWAIAYGACAFFAGFETHEHNEAAANATVSAFTTNAVSNALYAFADDPYVRTVDPAIAYRVGQANLAQTVTGFQAFMNAMAGQTFSSASYTGPYSWFFPVTITALLDASAQGVNPNQANVDVINLLFAPGAGEVSTGMGFRPNAGTQTNLFAGGPPSFSDVPATTAASNAVVIDNTAPTMTVPTLGGSGYAAPNVVVGNLEITTTATDAGLHHSGLNGRPAGQITWSDNSTTNVTTFSLTANSFRAVIPITSSTPNGPATLSLTVCDRAGNCATQTLNFTVSTVNIYLTVIQRGVDSNVSRVVTIKVGSSSGSTAPITVRKVVGFNTYTNAPGVDSRQGTVTVTYQDLDMADDNNGTNNSVPPAAALTRVYVKDPFFSLGKQELIVGTPSSLSGSVTLQMGDLTDNNVVNVSDLAVWAANNGTPMNPNTTLVQTPLPRQANVDGAGSVNLGDRNLILAAWLFQGDLDTVSNFRGGPNDGSQTIREVVTETGLPVRLVQSMDLNMDGRITREELLRWRNPGK